ncbi:pilin [Marinobacter daqiaonensis]|nr:pilin [Marinobacter daqiaonensis]
MAGFTLIELMITVAIIGILAVVAIPVYQSYVPKTQLTRTVAELNSYRAPVEDSVSNNRGTTNEILGFQPTELIIETVADPIATLNADGSGHLRVTLGGKAHPRVSGVVISLERTAAGAWECVIDNSANSTGWQGSFLPRGCRL